MGRPRSKICPDCNEHVASTAKICDCGGSVVSLKSQPSTSSQQPRSSRRTERTKRPKPTFYDGHAVEKQAREEKRRRKEKKQVKEKPADEKPSTMTSASSSAPIQSHRMQLTVKKVQEEPEVKEEELEEIVLSEEQRAKFSLILDDINRKICSSSWRDYL